MIVLKKRENRIKKKKK